MDEFFNLLENVYLLWKIFTVDSLLPIEPIPVFPIRPRPHFPNRQIPNGDEIGPPRGGAAQAQAQAQALHSTQLFAEC
jgi:hypothetical protein